MIWWCKKEKNDWERVTRKKYWATKEDNAYWEEDKAYWEEDKAYWDEDNAYWEKFKASLTKDRSYNSREYESTTGISVAQRKVMPVERKIMFFGRMKMATERKINFN